MTDKPDEAAAFTHYECRDCGFTSILAGAPQFDPCPLCEGDTGRANTMHTRPARPDDVVEGRNAMLTERNRNAG